MLVSVTGRSAFAGTRNVLISDGLKSARMTRFHFGSLISADVARLAVS